MTTHAAQRALRRVWRLFERSTSARPDAQAPAPSSPSLSLRQLEATPPSRALRVTIATLGALITALVIWAVLAQLDIVATAPGKLVPASQVKIVQAAEPGVVRDLLVRDGDVVTAGQVLLRMDATLATADRSQLAGELMLKRITVRAIDSALANSALANSALAGRALTMGKDDDPAVFAQISRQFSARLQALNDAIAQEQQAATRARHEQIAAQQVRDKLRDTLPVVRQSADSFTKLQKEGFVGDLLAAEKRREVIEREQDLKAQEATLQSLDTAIAQANQRTTQLRSNFKSQLLTERVEAQAAVTRLEQETAKQGFRSSQLELRAPQDGVVQNLATHTPGAVIQQGAPLLTLVPKGDALRAEAALSNEDIGFVEVGQSVKIKLAAYPFQKYGMLEGKVVQISADAVEPEQAAKATGSQYAATPLAYKAVIELQTQTLPLPGGGELRMTPGMGVTAEIHQGRRSVIEYLLSPVKKVSMEAGREK